MNTTTTTVRDMTVGEVKAQQQPPRALVTKFAGRYGVEPNKLLDTLKATAFQVKNKDGGNVVVSNEQMMALLVVADQYGLNPFTKEIYAFPAKGLGIVPVVGVDGRARIINEHPQFDGLSFDWPDDDGTCCVCTIYRKDRAHPIAVPEYLVECKRNTEPWNSHPRRMLRHKALIQCARVAFGFAGIYDPDEAKRIEQGGYIDSETGDIIDGGSKKSTGIAAVRHAADKAKPKAKVVDADPVVIDADPPADDPVQPEPKGADDPSAGALRGLSAGERKTRIGWIERSKTRDDALIVVDELRGDVRIEDIDALMQVVNKVHPAA